MVDCGVVLSQTACLHKSELCSQIVLMLKSLGKSIIKVSYYWLVHSYVLLVSLVEGTMVVRLDGCVDSFSMVVLVI